MYAETFLPDEPVVGRRIFVGLERRTAAHYFWSVATNPHPDRENGVQLVVEQTAATFDEDKTIIEAQYRNQRHFPQRSRLDIHVDVGPSRARRIIERLVGA